MRPALICIAKAPVPGRVKTRLCPPCTPAQAASVAAAALGDTLGAMSAAPASRRLIALDGEPGAWVPAGFTVVPQVPGGLDARIAGAFAAAEGPGVLVGMDTPQVTADLLREAAAALMRPGADAVLGRAPDGGYWAVGLREARADAFRGVPMSSSRTAEAQWGRLRRLGLSVIELPVLRDVDDIDDVRAVAAIAPRTRFAAVVGELGLAPRVAA